MYTREILEQYGIFDLRKLGRECGIKSPTSKKREELIDFVLSAEGPVEPPLKKTAGRPPKTGMTTTTIVESKEEDEEVKVDSEEEKRKNMELALATSIEKEGVFELIQDGGYGFLRVSKLSGDPLEKDAYVSASQIKKFDLRTGDIVKARVKAKCENKSTPIVSIDFINGVPAEQAASKPHFDDLVPIYPDERYRLEIEGRPNDLSIRCIDLISPIGKGQRAMIVSPPKAGKTTLLKQIANSISTNYPEAELYVLLIDERPEEVTDMQRSIKGEVIYSTFDETPAHHIKCAEELLTKVKRRVENKADCVILLDSLTRLARAYNVEVPSSGKTLSGGVDPVALHSPKKFFGAARNIENGGSLTIIATALIDTGSRMDDVIYEEFKGTGNMEIHLDRGLSEKRVFPAIDLNRSSTRREELLLSPLELDGMWAVRKMLMSEGEGAVEKLLAMIKSTSTNKDFLIQFNNYIKMQSKNLKK